MLRSNAKMPNHPMDHPIPNGKCARPPRRDDHCRRGIRPSSDGNFMIPNQESSTIVPMPAANHIPAELEQHVPVPIQLAGPRAFER